MEVGFPAGSDGGGMAYIEVQGLVKKYRDREVLHGVDLQVNRGTCVGILGPNGSGKTTTVECIGGLRTRDAGRISIDGMDPGQAPARLRHELGMQLQECRLPARMTVLEAVQRYRSFYPSPRDTGELLERFGLGPHRHQRFEKLSGGQQQRLSVALALAGNPRIAILDELTTGLDPAARREIWSYLGDLRQEGLTILLVTHSMAEAEALCDRVVLLRDGRVIADDSPRNLAGRAGTEQTLSFVPSAPVAPAEVLALDAVASAELVGSRLVVTGSADMPGTVLGYLGARGVIGHDLRLEAPDLDDAYLALTAAAADARHAAPSFEPEQTGDQR